MRIFFGATLPEKTRDQILEIQGALRRVIPQARFEGKEKLHITLQFIGEFRAEDTKSLFDSAVLRLSGLAPRPPLTEIDGVNYFPNRRVKRGIWLDCSDDGTLATLAGAIGSVSKAFGVEAGEREFKPHITMARIPQWSQDRRHDRNSRGASDLPALPEDLHKFMAGGKLSVERFFPTSVALFESTLKPAGSEYRILYEYPFEKSEA